MKLQSIAQTPYNATRIVYGCMGIGGGWDQNPLSDQAQKNAIAAVEAALDAGINTFDHADIYCFGKSELAFAKILQQQPQLRDKIILQSKCGIRLATEDHIGHYDFSYQHIINSVEQSLKRLQTSHLDILLLHRPDILVEGEEVAKAFSTLHQSGKVRFFGVSNHTSMQIAYLQKYVEQPIVVNQIQLNILHGDLFNAGIAGNCAIEAPGCAGLVEYCRIHDITLQAWGPLAAGKLVMPSQDKPTQKVQKIIDKLAQRHNTNASAIILAWILHHPARIQPVIGSCNPQRIHEACHADNIELTKAEWYELFVAGRGENLP